MKIWAAQIPTSYKITMGTNKAIMDTGSGGVTRPDTAAAATTK